MPQHQHHTLPALDEQLQAVINQGWEQEVLPQLPADYEAQAHRLGAFVRQGQLKRVSDLLRAVLAYVGYDTDVCSLSRGQKPAHF
jgi:hypothetical protein